MRNRGGFIGASRELFPVADVVTAYRLLFGIRSGIVPDGIDDLLTDDIDWAGDNMLAELLGIRLRHDPHALSSPTRRRRPVATSADPFSFRPPLTDALHAGALPIEE